MKIVLPILSFIAGWIVCYIQMTYGVDQDGTWVSNKDFDKD
jgi:hypothetical protein